LNINVNKRFPLFVCSTPLKSYDPDKLRSEEADEAEGEAEGEAEAEEKIRLKQYVSLHAKGRHNS
jgi:hypothetical protein